MERKIAVKTNRKGKGKMTGWIIALIIIAFLGMGGAIGGAALSKEQNEARNLPIGRVDFSKLNNGIYIGEYEGGMYKWRANKVQVAVSSGRVTELKLLSSSELSGGDVRITALYDRVLKAQSLQVDTVSGATLTSKAHLKAVENALEQAQED